MNTPSFPYQVIGEYVRGGCSIIYKIKDGREPESSKKFALKTMLPNEEDPQGLQRFYMEYEFLRAYPHPNLVEVREYFPQYQGNPAYVMEWVEGLTWSDYWRDVNVLERIPDFLSLLQQLCDALSFVHKHQIIHRDLKPQNILISNGGVLKVIDFGIMKVADMTLYTHRNTFMGSAYYVSPEGISGETVTHTADIFALGVILYDLFTGMKPYKGPTLGETIYQRLVKRPQPPSQIAKVPPALDEVILKMLHRDPRMRYQSCADVYRDIEKIFEAYKPRRKVESGVRNDVLTQGPLLHGPFIAKIRPILLEKRLLLLIGPEGSGKTTLLENLGASCFGELPLRLECKPTTSELDFMQAILQQLRSPGAGKPDLAPWIEILGSALPHLKWPSNPRYKSLGHSTILSAFLRVLFSVETATVLAIEEIQDATVALLQFITQVIQSARASSNKFVHLMLTSAEPVLMLEQLCPCVPVEFPDVVSMAEYLSYQAQGARCTLELTEHLIRLSGKNLSRFVQLFRSMNERGELVVLDGLLQLSSTGTRMPLPLAPTQELFTKTLPPELGQFQPDQITQLQWIALCPDGLNLNILKSLTKSGLESITRTLDSAGALNLVESQSSPSEGFRWKNQAVREFLVNALRKEEKRSRLSALAEMVEDQSRQYLAYSPPLWLILARINLEAGIEDKAADFAFRYCKYCFQNANYEPIRLYLPAFAELEKLRISTEFWCMLAFAHGAEDMERALEYGRRALETEENIHTLSLMAILHHYSHQDALARDFLTKTFSRNLREIDTHYASSLIPLALGTGNFERAHKLYQVMNDKLRSRNDLLAQNTLILARLQFLRGQPAEFLSALAAIKDELVPRTRWKLDIWAARAHEDRFEYEEALARLSNDDPSIRHESYRERLFLYLNFNQHQQAKALIAEFKSDLEIFPKLKLYVPLFQLAAEMMIRDPRLRDFATLSGLIHAAPLDPAPWLALAANQIGFQALSQEFVERLIAALELSSGPSTRNKILRFKIWALLKAGMNLDLTPFLQKALRRADELGLEMERLRLKILADFLIDRQLIPPTFHVRIPEAILSRPQTQDFLDKAAASFAAE